MTFKAAPIKPQITISDLAKVDIRVGTIISVEDVGAASKLVRFRVDFGDHQRTVLAGIKQERADPAALKGMQALFVVNLEARKMMGEFSEAMLFDLGYEDGIQPVLAAPEGVVPNGTRAG
jgi:tRNA-binding protein